MTVPTLPIDALGLVVCPAGQHHVVSGGPRMWRCVTCGFWRPFHYGLYSILGVTRLVTGGACTLWHPPTTYPGDPS